MEDPKKKLAHLLDILETIFKNHKGLIRLLEEKWVISRTELLQEMKK